MPDFDTSVPHIARVYDYWLGGKDNFAADRELGERTLAAFPNLVYSVRANRAFLTGTLGGQRRSGDRGAGGQRRRGTEALGGRRRSGSDAGGRHRSRRVCRLSLPATLTGPSASGRRGD
jgi:hypothetical protein